MIDCSWSLTSKDVAFNSLILSSQTGNVATRTGGGTAEIRQEKANDGVFAVTSGSILFNPNRRLWK